MTPAELGLVFSQLLSRRALYSVPVDGRRRTAEEEQAVGIIEANRDTSHELDEFLATQGLKLVGYDVPALGLGPVGRIYVAVRDPTSRGSTPGHIGGKAALGALFDNRRGDSQADAAIWGGLLMLVLLNLLYTLDARPMEAVSQFKDAEVDQLQFVEELRRRIAEIRSRGIPESGRARRVHEVLTKASDTQLETRAEVFLRSMTRLGVLEEVTSRRATVDGAPTTTYVQTLWSAVDVALNFKRTAGVLIGTPGVESVTSWVLAPEVAATEPSSPETN